MVFSKDRDRLIDGRMAASVIAEVLKVVNQRGLLS